MLARIFANAEYALKPGRLGAIFALMVIVALFASLPSAVAAQEGPGAIYHGIGFIDRHSVADGTIVEAFVRGKKVAATEIFDATYRLYIAEPPGESYEGEVISFKIGGLPATSGAGWEEGMEYWFNLHAYTELENYPNGFDWGAATKPEPNDLQTYRVWRASLLELEQERSELAAELEQQAEIGIAAVTNRWEGALVGLRAELDLEIERVQREFELRRRRLTIGAGSESILSKLESELDALITAKWADFEDESQLKEGYLDDEILEIRERKDFALNVLSYRIEQVETEIEELIGSNGLPFAKLVGAEFPESHKGSEPGEPQDDEPREEEKEVPTPKIPTPDEPKPNRGFFTNSISANPDGLNQTLDPTALAVIGILITLAATGAQLVKGN